MFMERMKEESQNETRRPKTSNASGKQAFKSIVKSKVISDPKVNLKITVISIAEKSICF